ncbi:MAG: Ig-like domain-containing protein [Muribaculaceae bacterium]|nr:Ig-like domain-containing protein [Muribaculaceae bacterium]
MKHFAIITTALVIGLFYSCNDDGPDAPTKTISAPSTVNAEINGTKVLVYWSQVESAESYEIYRSGEGSEYALIGTTEEIQYMDNNPVDGVNNYKVKARKGSVVSSFSVATASVSFVHESFAQDAVILRSSDKADMSNYELSKGEKLGLYIGDKSTKESYSYKNVSWTSSNPSVAQGDPSTGNAVTVMALDYGTTTITATDEKGGKLSVTVNVLKQTFAEDATILSMADKSYHASYEFLVGESVDLYIGNSSTKEPYSYDKARWTSGNSSIASVNPSVGNSTKVTACGVGTTTIIASDEDGRPLLITINVIKQLFAQDATILSLTDKSYHSSFVLCVGESEDLYIGSSSTKEPYSYYRARWTSGNSSIATVNPSVGNSTKVTACGVGTAKITATDEDGRQLSITIYVVESGEWVDLGLPSGTLWATKNVGASTPKDYGNYYAWGETSPKSSYTLDNYMGNDITSAELPTGRDAATANWGSKWRTPSLEQIKELVSGCGWTWTSKKGVNGKLGTSKYNNKTIFFPAAGYRDGTSLDDAGSGGFYWSRTGYDSTYAYRLFFKSVGVNYGYYAYEEEGLSVRAVRVSKN